LKLSNRLARSLPPDTLPFLPSVLSATVLSVAVSFGRMVTHTIPANEKTQSKAAQAHVLLMHSLKYTQSQQEVLRIWPGAAASTQRLQRNLLQQLKSMTTACYGCTPA
jgi:hypothetical protein